MIRGYKYYINPKSRNWVISSVDHNIEEYEKNMGYEEIKFATQQEFLDKLCSPIFVRELHEVYQTFIHKERLTVGIGSGLGEHELLLFLKGYNTVSSDIIPDLSRKVPALFPGFRGLTLNIFTDDIRTKLKMNNINETEYDILDSGIDFYFNEQKAQVLFDKLATNLNRGSNLVFTLRYPDSISRKFVEFLLYNEAMVNNKLRRKGIIQKHHGYRKSVKEIVTMANKSGFILKEIKPAMFGYECIRSQLLGKFYFLFSKTDRIIPIFNSAYVMKFEKE